MRVAGILSAKGSRVLTIQRTASILQAASRMTHDRVGALVVSEDGRNIGGIVSERDVLSALGRCGADVVKMKVEDIMTPYVETCAPQDDVKTVMSRMAKNHCRHMPVVGERGLCGIISVRDIVDHRLEEGEPEADIARDALIFSR